ncbi:MAG: hypothetical protein ACFFDB_12565 [Promethearchaeota archaeon]
MNVLNKRDISHYIEVLAQSAQNKELLYLKNCLKGNSLHIEATALLSNAEFIKTPYDLN